MGQLISPTGFNVLTAILIVACPCALALTAPFTLGNVLRIMGKQKMYLKNAVVIEQLAKVDTVVFDKTGTLTTGQFELSSFHIVQNEKDSISEDAFKVLAYALEKYSNHPIANCIKTTWTTKEGIQWAHIEEVKGMGIQATDKEGNTYWAGSFKTLNDKTTEDGHNIYIQKNNQLIGWIDVADQIRPEAKEVIDHLHRQGISTILLSGDRASKCNQVGTTLGIQKIIAEQSPSESNSSSR